MDLLVSTAYLPNINFFEEILRSEKIFIEKYENFPKQTYRNRTYILSANGVMPLVVPVNKGRSGKILTKDITLNYDENWQKQHFRSIMSAYKSAPFYDFFIDEFLIFFEKKYKFLIDFNFDILLKINKLLHIEKEIGFTDEFVKNVDINTKDLRFSLNFKNFDKQIITSQKPYIQVFADRFDFVPNMSIIDLIFNLGPEARTYLLTN
jgi:hypothetical protein